MNIREQMEKEMEQMNAEKCSRLYGIVKDGEYGEINKAFVLYGTKDECDGMIRRQYPDWRIDFQRRY